jgi:bifunctional non-homologous end joining protein LigD
MQPRFVIQKHQARTLHYDFRLEKDGVFKSWAVPKGIPQRPGTRRLAIQVEDHSLEYGDFQGTIPPGEYGAGIVEIWDRGTYEAHEWTDDKIVFTLAGTRLQGKYCLVRYRSKGEQNWLLFKMG